MNNINNPNVTNMTNMTNYMQNQNDNTNCNIKKNKKQISNINTTNQINTTNFKNLNSKNFKNSKEKIFNSEDDEDDFVNICLNNKKYNALSDKDLLNNVIKISKEQTGCRFLQQKIEDDPNFANYELYPEIFDSINDLIMDPFGNYLIQKILESLSNDKLLQVNKLVNKLKNFIYINFISDNFKFF